ncbi:MAG TPA: Flp pilus assembly protein CpaB [Dehalococcoidia bacterium]|nr:Flp pilus assembly protein CpaB [Dehalococcoidia bacterium]
MQRSTPANPRGLFGRSGGQPGSRRFLDRKALFLALALGLAAAVLIVVYLSNTAKSTASPAATVPMLSVVVAAQDIAAGEKVTPAMIELSSLPASAVISDAATSAEQVVGQTLRYPVAKGEQLNGLRLVNLSSSEAILSFRIPQGMRAFTVPVNVNNTPAALIAPGDFVDVVVTAPFKDLSLAPQFAATVSQSTGNDEREVTVTLLQNVQVLAVQREYLNTNVAYDASARGSLPQNQNISHVTLALTPAQGQLLWQVGNRGSITLALRAFGDADTGTVAPIMAPADQGHAPALSYQIPQGMRAFTVPVSSENTPASLIAPGDFVDVVVTGSLNSLHLPSNLMAAGNQNANDDRTVTVTLLQNVQVLAVQRQYLNTATPADATVRGTPLEEAGVSHVTLALTPEQGQLLWQAANGGELTLALRPFGDAGTEAVAPVAEAQNPALSFQIPAGLRAFTVPVNSSTTPASLIAPGDFVDVVVSGAIKDLHLPSYLTATANQNANDTRKVTVTLLQNVQVLAVQREYLNRDVPYSTTVRGAPTAEAGVSHVTLALTPEQGQLLWQAASGGELTLALRGFGDSSTGTVAPIAKGQSPTLSDQISPSMRAFTMPVQTGRTPAGVVAPGDFVDVLVGFMIDGRVETIMQDVQVLAVQQEYLNRENPYSDTQRGSQSTADDVAYVTLAVTPEESQMLWLAVMQEEQGLVRVTFTVRPVGESYTRHLLASQLIYPMR